MPKMAVITDVFTWDVVLGDLAVEQFFWSPTRGDDFPTADRLAELDMTIVIGPLADPGVAVQLSGVLKLALERSKATFVFAYPMHVEGADKAFLYEFGHPIPGGNVPNAVFGYPKEFHPYFTEYGMSGAAFYRSEVERATVVGWIHENEGPRAPTALCWETEGRESSTRSPTSSPGPAVPLAWWQRFTLRLRRTALRSRSGFRAT